MAGRLARYDHPRQLSNEKGTIMTAPLPSTSKLVLGTAIVCALLGGCNKHNESTTAPAATPLSLIHI